MSFETLATKYVGTTAENYERVRAGHKWEAEHDAIDELLEAIPVGSKVVDVPIGTGRLLPFFKARNFDTTGIDISDDMIAQSRATAAELEFPVRILRADIRAAPFPDGAFDLVACVRFLNLISESDLGAVLGELARLSSNKLLVGVRYITPWSEIRPTPWQAARLLARPIWIARWVYHSLFGYRKAARAHHQAVVFDVIRQLNLDVIDLRYVERRWDSTDYVLMMLGKRAEGRN